MIEWKKYSIIQLNECTSRKSESLDSRIRLGRENGHIFDDKPDIVLTWLDTHQEFVSSNEAQDELVRNAANTLNDALNELRKWNALSLEEKSQYRTAEMRCENIKQMAKLTTKGYAYRQERAQLFKKN